MNIPNIPKTHTDRRYTGGFSMCARVRGGGDKIRGKGEIWRNTSRKGLMKKQKYILLFHYSPSQP